MSLKLLLNILKNIEDGQLKLLVVNLVTWFLSINMLFTCWRAVLHRMLCIDLVSPGAGPVGGFQSFALVFKYSEG